jgi:competence protein ComEA
VDDETAGQSWMPAISSRQVGALMGLLGALALALGLWPQTAATLPTGQATAELAMPAVPDEGEVLALADAPTDQEPSTTQPPAEEAAITIYIVGAVQVPGVYVLPATARVHDAVARAGGLSPDADSLRVNLAQPIADGQQIVVPFIGEVVAPAVDAPAEGEGAPATGPLNINTASARELEELPKIGEALAARIVEHREANGPFASVEDLGAIKGVSSAVLSAIAPLVVAE